ncbi:MAG: hypothetical protein Kow0020_13950 [Wenzhouxiangellaceae bacterium]
MIAAFAEAHGERLWKQWAPLATSGSGPQYARSGLLAVVLGTAAALAVKVPVVFGIDPVSAPEAYFRNAPWLVLLFLALYFALTRRPGPGRSALAVSAIAVCAIAINLYPWQPESMTGVLTTLHLPVMLWLLIGLIHAGPRWRNPDARMDFIRFSGEWAIYFLLIGLGGGLLIAFSAALFNALAIDIEYWIESWILPCGAAGAVLIATWLVEAKQQVIENMAPVLTRLFSPLFTVVLLSFLVVAIASDRTIQGDREVLILFDFVLIVVLALVLYSISARDPASRPGLFDHLQWLLILAALASDLLALTAIVSRIGDYGLSPNRVAGLGLNLLLLGNLAGSAWLYGRFIRGRSGFADLEAWQTGWLPVFGAWCAFVALVFPLLFGFV